MAKPPTSVRSIRLPDDLWERLSAKAKERGTTVNAAMARAAEDWMAPKVVTPREIAVAAAKVIASTPAQMSDQAARDAKYARRDTWDPRFAAAPKKGRK